MRERTRVPLHRIQRARARSGHSPKLGGVAATHEPAATVDRGADSVFAARRPFLSSSTAGLVIVLGSVMAIGPLSIDMYLPAFPELAREFGASASVVQLTLTACVTGLALGQLLIGPLSDRFGRRVPLIAALVTYAVASVLCSLAPSIVVLLALRFVQGLAGAGSMVIVSAVVRDPTPARPRRACSRRSSWSWAWRRSSPRWPAPRCSP